MIEDRLREQLRRVDELTPPPAPDFAARAMRDADSTTSSGAGAGAGAGASPASVERTSTTTPAVVSPMRRAGRPGQARRTWGGWILGAAAAVTIGAFTITHLPGSNESSSSTAAGGVAQAPEVVKGGDSGTPSDQGATTGTLTPADTPGGVTVVSAACAESLATVRGALPDLTKQGLPLVSADCDAAGTVVIRVRTPLTTAQRTLVTTRFGPQIAYADLEGKRLP
ncbi:MAG: hypothetical protein ABI890_13890 [Lapillicoccus sp.]